MQSFNQFRTKRQAHTLSRTSSEQSWNPFRHVSWESRATRTSTWDVEQQGSRGIDENEENGERLTHAVSEPPAARGLTTEWSTAETMAESQKGGSRDGPETDAALDARVLQSDSAVDGSGLRNRSKPKEEEQQQGGIVDREDKPKKPEKEGFFRNPQPKEPFTVANQIQRTCLSSWVNILVIAAPVGIAINYIHSVNRVAVFVVNFIAIIPLAAILSFATEEIALRTGEVLGGLINATFGNAVELIVAILALIKGEVVIVQTSLIGSILSNLLLVMGCCFFFGGLRREQQHFNVTVAQTSASLLALAAASVIVPTVFDKASKTPVSDVASLSRGTAVILLFVYAAYLFFQLKTHHRVFSEESEKVAAKPWSHGVTSGAVMRGVAASGGLSRNMMVHSDTIESQHMAQMLKHPETGSEGAREEDEEEEEPQLHIGVAIATLTASTVLVALCAEFMVDSIDAVTRGGGISQEFVGLILLPIVGNAAEHATAVTVAIKDKMDLAIGVAVGSSMQVALFLIPLLVIIGWGMGDVNMNLSFDVFQVAVMFVAVLLVNYLIGDGKSHWLEGCLLISLYIIIAVCSWWYPTA